MPHPAEALTTSVADANASNRRSTRVLPIAEPDSTGEGNACALLALGSQAMTTMWGAPIHKRWRGSRLRDPRQARFLTVASLKWVIANRAYTPWYLVRYWRLLKFKLANPHVITRGMVFLGKNVEIHATPELAQLEIGRWVHIGDKNTIRAHEGSLRFGDKVVLGRDNVINCYLDIELGDSALMADWCYVCDFDHKMDNIEMPIKDQGIVKSPVRIGPDTWIATKVTDPARHHDRSRLRAGRPRRGQGRHPGLLDRRRLAGQGGQEPQAGLGDLGRAACRAGGRAGRHRTQEGQPLSLACPLSVAGRRLARGGTRVATPSVTAMMARCGRSRRRVP